MMNVATIEKTPPDKSEPPPVWWNFNQPRASDADRATVSHATAVHHLSQSRNRRATTFSQSRASLPCNHLRQSRDRRAIIFSQPRASLPCNHLSPIPNLRHHVTAVQPGAT